MWILGKTWKNVFKITEDEEENFDKQHSDHINAYINVNINRVSSFEIADMNRLNNDSYHTREISTDEIKSCTRKFKKKAPGASRLSKKKIGKMCG